jgi:hypothetical protein
LSNNAALLLDRRAIAHSRAWPAVAASLSEQAFIWAKLPLRIVFFPHSRKGSNAIACCSDKEVLRLVVSRGCQQAHDRED